MRFAIATLLSFFSSLGSFAQPGGCDGLEACFIPLLGGGNIVSFNSCSQPGINTQYVWHFGDGTDGSGASPIHSYAPGTYTACLVAYWNNCVDEFCLSFTIEGVDPCADYQACFVTNELQNNGYFFDNCSPQNNAQFQWDISDGSTFGTTNLENHFTAPGHYSVCLTGYWGNCVDSMCVGVDIAGGNVCDDLHTNFSFTPDANTAVFTNTTAGTGVSTTWSWEFGDGGTSNDGSPLHSYNTPGSYEVCLTAISVYIGPNGAATTCMDTYCGSVTVGDPTPCSNNFHVELAWNAGGDGVVFFNATSNFPQTNFIWYFGDDSEGDGAATTHTYDDAGTYAVCVTGWYWNESTGDTCRVEDCAQVIVEGNGPCGGLEACFVTSELPNYGFLFDNCSTAQSDAQFEWTYGDGGSGTSINGEHHYAQPGTYTVCLTAYWGNCHETTCQTVTITGPCDALFANFGSSIAGNSASFENATTGTGTNTTWHWDFGDGGMSDAENPDHVFGSAGVYHVCLTATSLFNGTNGQVITCQDTYCFDIHAFGGTSCDALQAGFFFTQGPNGVQFNNTTSGTGQETTFHWTFGDDHTSNDAQPFHTYTEPGTYEVCLTVITLYTGPNGQVITCEDTECGTVIVQGGGDCNGLVACFEALPLDNGVYLFDNCSTDPIPAQYVWHFGDGTTSTNNSPDHAFVPGIYTVCLTVYWGNCVDETCTTITVGGVDPCEGFNACFVTNYLQQPGAFFFDNCTAGQGNAQFVWDFGDGGSSTGTNVDHVYQENGNYTVCLTAYYGNCSDSTCVGVVVSDVGGFCNDLVACFEPQPFENGAYFFSNCSQLLPIDIPAYYLWDFGDGTTSDNAQPDHVFASGTYTVCLTVTHGNCVDETCTTITVISGPGCDPNYSVDFTWTEQGTAVVFASTVNLQTVGYIWHFGDGSDEGYESMITHLYEPPGPYEVCLDAWYWNQATEDTCWTYRCHLVDPFDIGNGIADIATDDITVFPIPAHNVLTVSGLPASATLRLFAADGRLVLTERASSTTHHVQVAGLASGTYVLRIDAGDHAMYRRVAVE